jgi:hypothetical protein
MIIKCKEIVESIRAYLWQNWPWSIMPKCPVTVRAWRQYSMLENSLKLWIEIDIPANQDIELDESVPSICDRPEVKPVAFKVSAEPGKGLTNKHFEAAAEYQKQLDAEITEQLSKSWHDKPPLL